MALWLKESEKKKMTSILEAFNLPPPKQGHIFSKYGGGLFLSNKAGLVFGLVNPGNLIQRTHPRFLRSLKRKRVEDYIFVIDPGIECGKHIQNWEELYDDLDYRYGITRTDKKVHNIGVLPTTDYHVLIDLDPEQVSIRENNFLRKKFYQIKQRLKTGTTLSSPPNDFQDQFYAPLIKAINDAWPDGEPLPDPHKAQKFMALCQEFKQDGKLVSVWERESYQDWSVAAQNYDAYCHKFWAAQEEKNNDFPVRGL